jgi:hypothetical protein
MNPIERDELRLWLSLKVTREFQARLIDLFDHQSALLSVDPKDGVALLKGRAQVLDMVMNPARLFEE